MAGAQYVFGAAFACCAVMALLWFRHRWPTRTESAVLVGVGTLAIAACSVVPASPLFGVLGAMTFSLITGYTAMFHTLRLLALTSTVVAATTAYLAVRVAAQSVGLALAVVILITLVNVFAAFTARLVVPAQRLTGRGGRRGTADRPAQPGGVLRPDGNAARLAQPRGRPLPRHRGGEHRQLRRDGQHGRRQGGARAKLAAGRPSGRRCAAMRSSGTSARRST